MFEELEHAKARGAQIYAEVLGYGASADAGHITQPDADGTGAARAMAGACATRKLESRRRSTTSTPTAPARRWATRPKRSPSRRVFGDHARKLSISSTKSQLGHLLGASGGVELVLCMLALRDSVMPADDQLRHARSGVRSRLHAQHAARAEAAASAMSNSFGFGGHNASIIAGAAA